MALLVRTGSLLLTKVCLSCRLLQCTEVVGTRLHNRALYRNFHLFSSNASVEIVNSNHREKRRQRPSEEAFMTLDGAGDDSGRVVKWTLPEGHDTNIKLYNSLTKRKEPLILPKNNFLTWYTCGPTVYDDSHIGHASSYICLDVMRRILNEVFNIDTVIAMGITDIDDKIIKRANEMGEDWQRVTKKYEQSFWEDMRALRIRSPSIKTKVTDHIPEIIAFAKSIIDNGYAYVTSDGTVYFDVLKYGRYGRLWTHSMETEIREKTNPEKRHARDFALWKAAKPGEPTWSSPWGPGRPGWHIECSTMASLVFGKHLDIHSGGDDLRFPHHENELAQSEACFECSQWANYWVHIGHLQLKNSTAKMSKSLKNTISVKELLEKYTANQFRLFCLMRRYRSYIEYSDEAMMKAVQMLNQWTSFLKMADAYVHGQLLARPINESHLLNCLADTRFRIKTALQDDFDTGKAVSALEDLIHQTNKEIGQPAKPDMVQFARSSGVVAAVVTYVEGVIKMFGLDLADSLPSSVHDVRFKAVMNSLAHFRGTVREFALHPSYAEKAAAGTSREQNKAWTARNKPLLQACDQLREDLQHASIEIMDHQQTSTWHFKESTTNVKK